MDVLTEARAKKIAPLDAGERDDRAAPSAAIAMQPRGAGMRMAVIVVAAIAIGFIAGSQILLRRYAARDVAISVGGTIITEEQIFHRMQEARGTDVLGQLIDEELTLQFAKQKGVMPSEHVIDVETSKSLNQPGMRRFFGIGGYDIDVRRQLRVRLARAALLTQGVQVTAAEVRRFYDANADPNNLRARYFTPEMVRVAVIVTPTKEDAVRARYDLSQGAKFPTIVRQYSVDSSRDNDGLLPWIRRIRTATGPLAGLEDELFRMKIGALSDPIQFRKTWWVVACLDKQPAVTQAFDAVRAECELGAKLAKSTTATAARLDEELAAFRAQAKIEAVWPKYRELVRTVRGSVGQAH